MKLALVVGIDDYKHSPLSGCVSDARAIGEAISSNFDHSPNFSSRLMTSSETVVTRSLLKEQIAHLFAEPAEVTIFYFAGHGTVNNLGGYLVTQDASRYDEGVSMVDILTMANQSRSRQVMILLDCCHSGTFGSIPAISNDHAHLREGISILSASRSTEPAVEQNGRGLFSALVLEALYGGASDLLGRVTVADLYAFVDRNLGPWDQRPLFKCHVSTLSSLRVCNPRIELSVLRQLPELFRTPSFEYQLDPSYERTHPSVTKDHEEALSKLRAYRAVGLLYPVNEPDMYLAALNSGTCRLTKLGEYYWHLAQAGRI